MKRLKDPSRVTFLGFPLCPPKYLVLPATPRFWDVDDPSATIREMIF
jgi:hypothetical protein